MLVSVSLSVSICPKYTYISLTWVQMENGVHITIFRRYYIHTSIIIAWIIFLYIYLPMSTGINNMHKSTKRKSCMRATRQNPIEKATMKKRESKRGWVREENTKKKNKHNKTKPKQNKKEILGVRLRLLICAFTISMRVCLYASMSVVNFYVRSMFRILLCVHIHFRMIYLCLYTRNVYNIALNCLYQYYYYYDYTEAYIHKKKKTIFIIRRRELVKNDCVRMHVFVWRRRRQ